MVNVEEEEEYPICSERRKTEEAEELTSALKRRACEKQEEAEEAKLGEQEE